MIISKGNVMACGQQAAIDALQCQSAIEVCLSDSESDLLDKLRDLAEDQISYLDECYRVEYYHEAWDIVNDSDFEASETVDFSGCSNALECVLMEANASVGDVVREGWDDQLETLATHLSDLLETMRGRMGYKELDIEIKIGSGSQYGWAAHNYETEYSSVWDDAPDGYNPSKLEGELYAIEAECDGVCFYYCWNPDTYLNIDE